MKLNFNLLTRLIDFCNTGRTVTEMRHKHDFDFEPQVVQATIDFMIKNHLIIKTPMQIRGGSKQPTTWVKSSSLEQFTARKAG